MKKILTIAVLFLAAVSYAPAQGFQSITGVDGLRIGARGGIGISIMSGSFVRNFVDDMKSEIEGMKGWDAYNTCVCNFYVGVYAQYLFNEHLGIQAGIDYNRRGTSFVEKLDSKNYGKQRLRLEFVDIPVMFHAEFLDSRLGLSVGPVFEFCAGVKGVGLIAEDGNTVKEVTTLEYKTGGYRNYNKFNLGLGARINYMFMDNLGVELAWDSTLSNFISNQEAKKKGDSAYTSNLNTFQVGLVCRF